MKDERYILSIDQGTTSTRAIVFDMKEKGVARGAGQKEFTQIYPQSGYVEHDAVEILESVLFSMRQAVYDAGINASQIAAISITNQRETTVAWDSETGTPICNAIVWQCRRTAGICEELIQGGYEEYIKDKTGLVIDPYFSGTKMKWILENVPAAKSLAEKGRLRFGTIDTWLVYSLSDGESYVTDVTNASRTMIFDIHEMKWDEKLVKLMGIPAEALPEIVDSSGIAGYCQEHVFGRKIPIAGIAGDQHAALFGQCCFKAGMAKNTYGTGCFILMNTGEKAFKSKQLLTTVAWKIGDKVTYALEGSAFNAGSAIKWLRDELGIISSAQECDMFAESVDSNGGVFFVPAFTGLGAPYWNMYARGVLIGITRGTSKAHICRAVLESIAYESYDLLKLLEAETGINIEQLRVDGGASRSAFLMQFQADMLDIPVNRPEYTETTALGSAMLAALASGIYSDIDELNECWSLSQEFTPSYNGDEREANIKTWHKAVNRSLDWI